MADSSRSFTRRASSFSIPLLAIALLGGCGQSKTADPPAAAPAKPAAAPEAAQTDQTNSGQDVAANSNPAPSTTKSTTKQSSRSPAFDGAGGADELGGSEGAFVLLEDPAEGGSLWTIDSTAGASGADRFALTELGPGANSTTFTTAAAPPSNTYTPGTGTPGTGNSRPPQRTVAVTPTRPAKTASADGDTSATTFEIPEGFTPDPDAGQSPEGLPLRIRGKQDDVLMALVPEGTFSQGKNGRAPNAAPEHSVLLDPFYIDVHEVTSAQFERYRDVQREAKKRIAEPGRKAANPDEPVAGVTWAEAHAYALWAGKDLPTEAQWEKAARGADSFDFPWGNGPYVWHKARAPGQIDLVMAFRGDLSPSGIFDLAGNVREWCNDWYADKAYVQIAAEATTARNPAGPKASGGTNQRVVKGGDANWFAWARTGVVQTDRPSDVGFRCVVKLKPAKAEGSGASKTGKTAKKPARPPSSSD